MSRITVHHLNDSRSQRVLWLLEELGLDYDIERYQRDPQTMRAPKALRNIHPLGKAPILVDQGVVIAETGAIVSHLVDGYGRERLRPPAGSEADRRYTHWLHYAEGSLMPLLLLKLVFEKIPAGAPALIRPIARAIAAKGQAVAVTPQANLHLDFIEGELARGPWLTGDQFTAADIMMSFPLEAAGTRNLIGNHPRIRDLVARMHARPAWKAALDKGGPYSFA